jgi:hypothetical protein
MALEVEADLTNQGFLRDDLASGIHMIIVSDEPDASFQIGKDEFIGWANGTRPEDELVTWNSICVPPLPGPAIIPDGQKYVDLTEGIGGLLHDIRNADWANVLDELGLQAAGLHREYYLSHRPVVDTIEVKVVTPDGDTLPFDANEWKYDQSRNSITFEQYLPDPLAEVYITYTVLSSMVEISEGG